MSRDFRVYLEDILEAIRRIEIYTNGLTLEQLAQDTLHMDAVLRNIQIIGEGARQIPDELRNKYLTVEWNKIVGLRNIVTHEYFRVNPEIIWSAIETRIPELRDTVRIMLTDEDFSDEIPL